MFEAGESFLLNDTYCRDVYSSKATIALTEIDGVLGLQRHPLYCVLALEAYISTPIFKDDAVWGTLNFSCMKTRSTPFSDDEIKFVETNAKKISELI